MVLAHLPVGDSALALLGTGFALALDNHNAAHLEARIVGWTERYGVGLQIAFGIRLRHSSLQGDHNFGPLLHPLLLRLLNDRHVRIAHHGDQHVKQQDRHEYHEDDKNRFRQVRIGRLVQIGILFI